MTLYALLHPGDLAILRETRANVYVREDSVREVVGRLDRDDIIIVLEVGRSEFTYAVLVATRVGVGWLFLSHKRLEPL